MAASIDVCFSLTSVCLFILSIVFKNMYTDMVGIWCLDGPDGVQTVPTMISRTGFYIASAMFFIKFCKLSTTAM